MEVSSQLSMRRTALRFAFVRSSPSTARMRAASRSGLMIQTERPNASMLVSWYALLLPEPFGPATIRKTGGSALGDDNVCDADYTLIVATRLGDIPVEHVP